MPVAGQCYGLDCVEEALPGSKYCSAGCGIRLATERIYRVQKPTAHLLAPAIMITFNAIFLCVIISGVADSNPRMESVPICGRGE